MLATSVQCKQHYTRDISDQCFVMIMQVRPCRCLGIVDLEALNLHGQSFMGGAESPSPMQTVSSRPALGSFCHPEGLRKYGFEI